MSSFKFLSAPVVNSYNGSLLLKRIESIDLMRGLVMALMALDHTRDFFSNIPFSPTDLSQTTAALFFTRWITHFCAPIFVFLTGVSAYLYTVRYALTTWQLAKYLIIRGVWLIVLELTIVRFGWTFSWNYHDLSAAVIWALGWSMVVLAGLVFLPRWAIGLFALVLITGHNLFDTIQPADLGTWGWLWTILHVPGRIDYLPGYSLFILYPLIPWLGVMAAGYWLAPVFLLAPKTRKTLLLILGLSLITAFLVLRLNNIYGNPPWFMQKNTLFTLLAILNCEKYPPSLLYLLMTLGPMLLGLVVFETVKKPWLSKPLSVFGKVPLFFYLIHLILIHGAAVGARDVSSSLNIAISQYRHNLLTVYIAWVLLLIPLYLICRRYARFKQQHPEIRWLAYL